MAPTGQIHTRKIAFTHTLRPAGTTTNASAYQEWEVQPRMQHPPAQLAPSAKFEGASESASQFQQKPIAPRNAPAPAQLPEHLPFEGA